MKNIRKILIANRGEIACRIIKTAQRLGIKTVAVHSSVDEQAMFVAMADEAVQIGAPEASQSYLVADKIIAAAKRTGADAIHPGYGFLSENPEFTDLCAANDITFIGPSGDAMRAMALKGTAKQIMIDAGVPVVPGYHGEDQDLDTLQLEADSIGYPVLIKAVAGGGGKGMRTVENPLDLKSAVEAAAREGQNSFGNPKLLIEKLITRPRHIEVQVFGGPDGKAVHLLERDCSLQRRHQKVLEEAPAPGMTNEMRRIMGEAAVKAADAIAYKGAGTVEFIVDVAKGLREDAFYFMEMNTRLQVEHPVTEMITGVDLVEWQIRVAEGKPLPLSQDEILSHLKGHAFEARLYAEDPNNNFMPSIGKIGLFDPFMPLADGCRIDTGVQAGDHVTVYYDPMIAKLITWGADRACALAAMQNLVKETAVSGLATNRDFIAGAVAHPAFMKGDVHTGFIAEHEADLIPQQSIKAQDYAIGAAIIRAHRSSPASNDPWLIQDNFRMNLPNNEDFLFDGQDGERIKATRHHNTIRVLDQAFSIAAENLGCHKYRITLDGHTHTLIAEITDTCVTIIKECATIVPKRHASVHIGTDESDGPGTVTAPMPGKILEVKINNGESVERGDPILLMEAMKMEQTITAPRAGRVTSLTVKAGDLVGNNAVLCEITDPE